MSRLETGQRAATPADVAAFCGLCRVARPVRVRLVELAADAFVTTWVQPLEGQPPDALHTLLHEESIARRIDIYDPLVIPPLAQTEDYTRALIDHTGTDAAITELLSARTARQQALATAGRAWLTLFIPEPVLTSPIGGDRVIARPIVAFGDSRRAVNALHNPYRAGLAAVPRVRTDYLEGIQPAGICGNTDHRALSGRPAGHAPLSRYVGTNQ